MPVVACVAQLLCCHSDYQLLRKPLHFLYGCACALSAAVSVVASGDALSATQSDTKTRIHSLKITSLIWVDFAHALDEVKLYLGKKKESCDDLIQSLFNLRLICLYFIGAPSHISAVLLLFVIIYTCWTIIHLRKILF